MRPSRRTLGRVLVTCSALLACAGCTADVSEEREEGISLYKQDRAIEAMATFRHCLTQRPNDAPSNYYMGLCYREIAQRKIRQGDIAGANRELDTAIVYFDQAIREWPNYEAAVVAQNEAMETRGKYDRALNRAEQIANEIRPDADAHVFLGKQFAERGDYDSAARNFRIAIEIDPNNAAAYAELGRLYIRAGDLKLAGTHLRKAYELDPDEPGVSADLERVYAMQEGALANDAPERK
jgi:tetratricopeptide (TPR) repeat protein